MADSAAANITKIRAYICPFGSSKAALTKMNEVTRPKYISSIHNNVKRKFFQFNNNQEIPIKNNKIEKFSHTDQNPMFVKKIEIWFDIKKKMFELLNKNIKSNINES